MDLLSQPMDEHTFDLALNATTTLFTFLLFLGFATALLNVYALARFLHLYFYRTSALPRYTHGRPHHAWALVTGASDGIGAAFASELASQGFNVILQGRNEAEVASMVEILQKTHPETSFRTLIADASTSHGMKSTIESMTASLSTLPGPLTILLNNVGGAGGLPSFTSLAAHTHADVDGLLNLNIRFATQLTRALLPLLRQNTPSLILNSGSGAGRLPLPYLGVYSGCKAYLRLFTASLAQELAAEGADIEVMLASIGNTGNAGGHGESKGLLARLLAPSAARVARGALERVGCGRVCVPPVWEQGVVEGIMMALPEGVVTGVLGRVAKKERAERGVGEGSKKDE